MAAGTPHNDVAPSRPPRQGATLAGVSSDAPASAPAASTSTNVANGPTSQSAKPVLTTAASAAKAVAVPEGAILSPSLASILSAFSTDGRGDTELLKVLLVAKAKEDERLAALDALRAEQLRAANTLAQQAYWYTAAAAHAPVAPLSPASTSSALSPTYAPMSFYGRSSPPLSPPSEQLPAPSHSRSTKRPISPPASEPRSRSSSCSSSKEPSPPAAKRAKTLSKHEDAMAALRAKCSRNQAAAAATHKVPPPRATALVSSIRSTSGSPPPAATSAVPRGTAFSGRHDGGSLRMLLNAAQGQEMAVGN